MDVGNTEIWRIGDREVRLRAMKVPYCWSTAQNSISVSVSESVMTLFEIFE
jgi:hypothetical protein